MAQPTCYSDTSSILAGAPAEFGAERPIEVGNIAEAAIQSDIENIGGLGGNPDCRLPQAGAEHILVRRDAGERLESSQKMIRAEISFAGEISELVAVFWSRVDQPSDTSHTDFRICVDGRRRPGDAAVQA